MLPQVAHCFSRANSRSMTLGEMLSSFAATSSLHIKSRLWRKRATSCRSAVAKRCPQIYLSGLHPRYYHLAGLLG